MDLSPFCGKDETRPYLMQPWTRGDWTYATNGHILLRVPARPTVPDNDKAPAVEKLFADHPGGEHIPLPQIEIPEVDPQAECDECEGRGMEHDCPSCSCTCRFCDGTGSPPRGLGMSVGIKDATYSARYVLLLQTLPNVQITTPSEAWKNSMHFTFDGGEGLLMGIRGKSFDNHIEAKAA